MIINWGKLPGLNDPGGRLIAAALAVGVPVTVLPGASAAATAFVASGLPAERFQFVGYLPRGDRALEALWRELEAWPHAVVAYESPQRLPAALAALARVTPERPVAVCRELTKAFEEVVAAPRRRWPHASRRRRRARSRSSSARGRRPRTSDRPSRRWRSWRRREYRAAARPRSSRG